MRISDSKTYKSWAAMRSRCLGKYNIGYRTYGGAGITIAKRWNEFGNFLKDMGERPLGKSLDRIDNSKGYSKDNCRWATPKEQSNNKRNNVFLEYKGNRMTMAQWARKIGIDKRTLFFRIRKLNWTVEKALNTPVRSLSVRSF